ncbi:hypothetical protein [Amycolatopsis sp. NPDC004079]|uniref:hypothetical protein n=1 Tax=Amycolatopsis sp. NPDC004079 TaxID=3154549 RepID=UPI0033B7B62B
MLAAALIVAAVPETRSIGSRRRRALLPVLLADRLMITMTQSIAGYAIAVLILSLGQIGLAVQFGATFAVLAPPWLSPPGFCSPLPSRPSLDVFVSDSTMS